MFKYFSALFLGSLFAVSFGFLFCACSYGDFSDVETSTSFDASGAWVAPYSSDPNSHTEYLEDNDIYFITDPDTGVQYIVYREKVGYAGMGGITPRLRSDGSLYVVNVEGAN